MLDKEKPPVELYLDRFEALYRDLMSFVPSSSTGGHALSVEFWPFKLTKEPFPLPGPDVMTMTIIGDKDYAFSKAAMVFGRLEDAGWSRRVLYEFLRDKVERSECALTVQQKADFALAMEKMCNIALHLG
jgi:hypothetical protein